ncbi:MAG: ABC transporter permease [Anaerolineae bacterium]|nr:ABC transporter permease [Anaerolineae bacterium]
MDARNRMNRSERDFWRIVGAIATKDVVEAVRNKTTLTVVLGLSMMMLTVQALPLLLQLDSRTRVAIYDAGRTTTADEMREAGSVQIYERRSAEEVPDLIRESSGATVGVILPAEFANDAESVVVEGYVPHWIRPNKIDEAATQAEVALSAVIGRNVTIAARTVYPTTSSGGHAFMVSLGLVLAVLMITAILVPYLLLEEKVTHTLDLLRVSPVTTVQLVIGKTLAGLVYGVLAALVLLAFNLFMVVNWPLLFVTVLFGALFGVSVGLLAGIVSTNEGGVQFWVALVSVLFVFPILLSGFAVGKLPAWLNAIVAWLPSTNMFDLFRLSFTPVHPVIEIVSKLGIVLLWTFVVFGLVVWRLRRWER